MARLNIEKIRNKHCFWRHGPFKTIKLHKHRFKEKDEDSSYSVDRIIIIQECQNCGKLIVENSNDS